MKIIITESQNNSLKNKLIKIKNDLGLTAAMKVVNGIKNYIRIAHDGDTQKVLDELFAPIFDRLKMRRRYNNWPAFDWYRDGQVVIQKDSNGILYIFGTEEYNELQKIKKLVEPTGDFFVDIKEALNVYVNNRYKKEFGEDPVIINHI
jgi:hypothetical protein